MWILFKDGSISLSACERNRRSELSISGRGGPLQRMFPEQQVPEATDLHFGQRLLVGRDSVAVAIARQVLNINYTSFEPCRTDLNPGAGNYPMPWEPIPAGEYSMQPAEIGERDIAGQITFKMSDNETEINVFLSAEQAHQLIQILRFQLPSERTN